jgi:hypothetical protein
MVFRHEQCRHQSFLCSLERPFPRSNRSGYSANKTLGVHALTMPALLFRIVCLLAFAGVSDGAAKVKRVKAGKSYKTHDAVHIVVNKVG